MEMVSYWTDEQGGSPTPFYINEEEEEKAAYIVGIYSQNNENPKRAMGIYYDKGESGTPCSRGRLTPLVIPRNEAILLLEGLLKSLIQKALIEEKMKIEKKEEKKSDSPKKESASSKAVKVAEALAFLLKQ